MSVNLCNFSHYSRAFPLDVPIKVAQGFVASVVITLIAGGSGQMALLGGAMAVTATLIGAVIQPILRAVFPQHSRSVGVFLVVIPESITVILADSVAPWIGVSYKATSVVLSVLAFIALNINDFNLRRNMALAHTF